MKKLITLFLVLACGFSQAQPVVSFTFDDGTTADMPGYAFEEWNDMLLDNLDKENVKAIFFVTGKNKTDERGRQLLQTWNDLGHRIANHTFTHPNYNNETVTFQVFEKEFLLTDSIIKNYPNHIRLFRFPYLKEGNTKEKAAEFRTFLEEKEYKNGYVTVDASDWYINSRLLKKLKENPNTDLEPFKEFYLEHLLERATFYEDLSYRLTGRHIKHTLLLHHNLAAALFLDDLAEMFKSKGWEIVSAEEAYQDPIYEKTPTYAGESLIWALAKDSGLYDELLRDPPEDMRYEKSKMDDLGL